MKNTKTVLKEWAANILSEVSEFDFDESVVAQYGSEPDWQKFFGEMAHSRGWSKIIQVKKIREVEKATDHMVVLLDRTIEEMQQMLV